jgi:hypothetical protein
MCGFRRRTVETRKRDSFGYSKVKKVRPRKTMPRFNTTYEPSVTAKAKGKLKDLAKRNPKTITLKSLIQELRPEIEQAKAVGHSLKDIVVALGESGVSIKESTLKQYLREVDKNVSG